MKVAGATSVASYLANLPPDRRDVIATMRDVVNANMPTGYEESLGWGMIMWSVPLSRFPNTYNGQALCYAALAAQKNHYALYLMCVYGDRRLEAEFRDGFARDGKTLDMGKSCVRFKRIEDLSLSTIERAIRAVPPEGMMAMHEASHNPAAVAMRRASRRAAAPKNPAAKKKPAAMAKPAAKKKPAAKRKPVARKKTGARRTGR